MSNLLFGCEAWLYPGKAGIHEKEVLPAGSYFMARKDREANRYCGVIIAAKNIICGTEPDNGSTSEIVADSFNGLNNSQLKYHLFYITNSVVGSDIPKGISQCMLYTLYDISFRADSGLCN